MLKQASIIIVALASWAVSVPAQTQTAPPAKADSKTTDFIKEAAKINDSEIALGELGARKAENPDLKAFSQQMQQDHTQANQQLQPIAQKYGVSLEQPIKGKAHHEVAKLEKASGANFDKEFATAMLKNHEKAYQKFQKAATELSDPEVKQYAETMLPKLRQHFDRAATVAQEVGVSQSTISSYSKKLPPAVGGTSEEQNTSQGAGASNMKQGTSGGY